MNKIKLDKNWILYQISGTQTAGKKFAIEYIPCQVHDVLIKEHVIENPNLRGINHDTWIGESDWRYENTFYLEDLDGDWNLIFDGLDTFADIYLNDQLIAHHESAYMPCRAEKVPGLKKGLNYLRIDFSSSVRKVREMRLPEEYDKYVPDFCRARVFRSGFYDFSGPLPTLVRVGIYGNIWLEQIQGNAFKESAVTQWVAPDLTTGILKAELSYYNPLNGEERIKYFLRDSMGTVITEGEQKAEYVLEISVNNPQLWWPRSHGNQPLYELELQLISNGRILDIQKKRTGFRRIEKKGDMDFIINGKPLKLWGINLVQVDTVSGCYHRKRMEKLLTYAEAANCNSLRIWGESEILPDEFYEECDRRGFLLWHDFYIGYNMYSIEKPLMELYQKEAIWLVNRLKHHPCILLWCGGNEILLSRDYQYPGVHCYGEEIFTKIYPELCRRLDPDRYYHLNCPSGGKYANDPRQGDSHGYTHQWYVPGARYPVFLSENARFSAPALRTMKRMLTEEELWPSGYTGQSTKKYRLPWPVTWDQHCCGEKGLRVGAVEHYYDADNAEALIYNLGAAYSEYIKKEVERFRRGKPDNQPDGERRTKGHFLWKLNNCSNLIAHGIIDYFDEPQMAYYALKRAYSPLLPSFCVNDRITFWLVNDTPEYKHGTARIQLFSIHQNTTINTFCTAFEIGPDESKLITDLDMFGQFRKDCILAAEIFDEENHLITWNLEYVDIERHIHFPEDCGIHAEIDHCVLTLSCERFARNIELLGNDDGDEFGWFFEDNYFDLLPGMKKQIRIYGRHQKGKIIVKPYYNDHSIEVEMGDSV